MTKNWRKHTGEIFYELLLFGISGSVQIPLYEGTDFEAYLEALRMGTRWIAMFKDLEQGDRKLEYALENMRAVGWVDESIVKAHAI